MTPHYADEAVTLFHSDCLDVLARMPDASVDAVVTDPPYGLEFMGREWDAPWTSGIGKAKSRGMSDGRFKGLTIPESFNADANVKCANCQRWKKDHADRKCTCPAPDFPNVKAQQANVMQEWHFAWASECLRVLKPGGFMLAFGGTRTYHRLTCAIEDAGFEVRDTIAWLYGSGFPKSLDVSKAIDKAAGAEREVIGPSARHVSGKPEQRTAGLTGSSTFAESIGMGALITAPATDDARRWTGWGTALKPAHEPIVVARKPLVGTVAQNVTAHGTGALNIDGCRVGYQSAEDERRAREWPRPNVLGRMTGFETSSGSGKTGAESHNDAGRWPTNVVLSHAEACGLDCCADGCPVAELDRQSGVLTSGKMMPTHTTAGVRGRPAAYGADAAGGFTTMETYGDTGGASRFFPVFRYEAKAPSSERPRVGRGVTSASAANRCAVCGKQDLSGSRCECPEPQWVPRGGADSATAHPTVKPLDLMRWLVRLVTPPGGLVLDPFAGSGTTAEACVVEGFRCITIEREADYLPLIVARLSKPLQPVLDFGDVA